MEITRNDGKVVIHCLTEAFVPETAALLTDAVSEAMGYLPPSRYDQRFQNSKIVLAMATTISVGLLQAIPTSKH
jgi:hypothetical protein